jgi:hypothetical protein
MLAAARLHPAQPGLILAQRQMDGMLICIHIWLAGDEVQLSHHRGSHVMDVMTIDIGIDAKDRKMPYSPLL